MLKTDPRPGGPNWLDLGVTDIPAAAAFYRAVLGWEFVSYGPEAGGYGGFTSGGRTVAALGPLMDPGATSSWTIYFQTPDAEATAKAVEQAGGTVRVPPGDVFEHGRMAAFTDPAGGEFAVWQPRANHGIEAANEPGALSWVELYSTDADRAVAFYREVFDWGITDAPMMPEYHMPHPAGGTPDDMFGGIMQLPEEHQARGNRSEWHPYIEVDDVDAAYAAAESHGASGIIAPMDAEGIGRMAMFVDPFGATLALIHGEAS